MSNDVKISRVNLDGVHSLDISVNEKAKTVVAELVFGDESTFIYAEKFDAPCNYLRTAIKRASSISTAVRLKKSPSAKRKRQKLYLLEYGKICDIMETENIAVIEVRG